jgi:hypothetical protein
VTSPNGGEIWLQDTVQNITWTHNLLHQQVNLSYSTDNGSNWTFIALVNVSDLSYSWTVPNQTSTLCKVRIVDALDTYALDASDAVFSLVNPAPPSVPQVDSLAFSGATGLFTLYWTPSTGNPTSYRVEASQNPSFVSSVLVGTMPSTQNSYSFPPMPGWSTAFYRVVAIRD